MNAGRVLSMLRSRMQSFTAAGPQSARRNATNLSDIPALVQAGRTAEAERRLRAQLVLAPDNVDALQFLGLLCHQSSRLPEALALLGKAVTLAPNAAFLHANYAEVLRVHGDLEAAERHAREAMRLAPGHADFQFNLAVVLAALRRHAEAVGELDAVLAAQPDRVAALALKAEACFELGRMQDALCLAERASLLSPGDVASRINLLRMRAWACDWRQRDDDVAALTEVLARCAANPGSPAPAGLSPLTAYEYPVPQVLRDALTHAYVANIRKVAGASLPAPSRAASAGRDRLRLGYVSANFNSHPMMHLLNGFFRKHDRRRFEVFAYSIGADDGSDYRRRAMASMDHFIDIRNESARQSAGRIRADDIDILIDLMGFTVEARPEIFALRPAPIQAAWLGYPASTGPGLNDYAIVDRITVPRAHAGQFSEKLVWMPHSYQVNDDQQPIAAEGLPRRELGLPENGFVYACFNHVRKIDPQVFRLWMRILARVPGSVMWLYASNGAARENLQREAARQGVAGERIVFGETMAKPAHLARLANADLFLDTYFYNAHTSASDALWAGVPVLTRPGDAFPARVGASLVTAAGLPQLVCDSEQAYEAAAVRLAGHSLELASLRRSLAARERLPLFDTAQFTRNIERAFETMWQRYQAGVPVDSFEVV